MREWWIQIGKKCIIYLSKITGGMSRCNIVVFVCIYIFFVCIRKIRNETSNFEINVDCKIEVTNLEIAIIGCAVWAAAAGPTGGIVKIEASNAASPAAPCQSADLGVVRDVMARHKGNAEMATAMVAKNVGHSNNMWPAAVIWHFSHFMNLQT